jgi:hypothetical protein
MNFLQIKFLLSNLEKKSHFDEFLAERIEQYV